MVVGEKLDPACQRWREALNQAAANHKSSENVTDLVIVLNLEV